MQIGDIFDEFLDTVNDIKINSKPAKSRLNAISCLF